MEISITTDYAENSGCCEPFLRKIAQAGFTHIHWCHHWNGDFLYSRSSPILSFCSFTIQWVACITTAFPPKRAVISIRLRTSSIIWRFQFIRWLYSDPVHYDALPLFFRTTSWTLDSLLIRWISMTITLFPIIEFNDRLLLK